MSTLLSVKIAAAAVVPQSLLHAVPADVAIGDSFHLLFVTRAIRDANSTVIGDFNLFVNAVANSAGIGPATAGIDWFAVASTPDVHARENALVQAPVYNMRGDLLASGFADMWDGALATAINYDERAEAITSFHLVWTGSRKDGTAYPARELGQFPTAEIGDLKLRDGRWLETSNASLLVETHMYALSESLVVVAEPTGIATAGIAVFGIAIRRRRRHLR